ncbi:MAG TPA: FAD-binding oxidoreductase [Pseudonocardia sp.]|nr:FAD-binding oxidoreductase [Pseudonocardia sp.]
MTGTTAVVVGGGSVGSAVTHRLASAGVRVTLVDGGDPAGSLSAHSFGWINPVDNGSAPYYALTEAALAAHRRLAESTGGGWLHQAGNLHWADTPAGRDDLLAEAGGYRSHGYPVLELEPSAVTALEPGLRLGEVTGPVVYYPTDGHVLGDRMIAVLQDRARELGATVITGDRVVGLTGSRRVGGVRLASGRTLAADHVVCCAGRATNELLQGLGVTIPLVEPDDPGRLVRGLLVRTTPVAGPVRRVVHAPGLSIRPAGGGRLVLRCRDVDLALTAGSRPDEFTGAVLDRLAAVLPGAAGAGVESAFLGERPIPRDGLSVLGPVRQAEGVYVAVTHSGLTLAAVVAEIVECELRGVPHPLAAAFRPDRLATAAR